MSVLSLLPAKVADKSISNREVVLPMREALEAIDIFETLGLHILGWEGWVKCADGRVGHGSAPQGTVSLEHLSIHEAAQLCRKSIPEDAADWEAEHQGTPDELHFCITVRT